MPTAQTDLLALDIARVRSQFPSLSQTVDGQPAVFLDGPGGTQVPQRVIDAIGGGYGGYFNGSSASYHQYRPPCKTRDYYGRDSKCHKAPRGHNWHYTHGWCWLENGHGGFKWGYGNGWADD